MAHFKRKRPKEHTIRYCGYRHCKQDKVKFKGNGRYRYLPMFWKKLGGIHPWRYYGRVT